jgi:hypothetical protein
LHYRAGFLPSDSFYHRSFFLQIAKITGEKKHSNNTK